MEPFTLTVAAERFQTFVRSRPWILDAGLGLVIVVIGAVSRPALAVATPTQILYAFIVGCCAVAIAMRRTWPRTALTVVTVLLLAHVAARIEFGVCVAAIYAIVAYTSRTQLSGPWRWACLVAAYAGSATAIMTAPSPVPNTGVRERLIVVGVAMGMLTLAVLAGAVRSQRRSRYDSAIERAAMLQMQQDTERRLAVVEERTHIAREMHDIIGHSLNAIAAQAEGVRYILRSDIDRADQALADIGSISRNAVDDVRELIDVLAQDSGSPTRPAPTISDIPGLIASLPYATTRPRFHVSGDPDTVSARVGLTAYRIVQESLTNAIKHAEASSVTVHVAIRDQAVDLTISNTAVPVSKPPAGMNQGRGIVGLQERARAIGGTVTAGPDPTTGGWRVAASLPRPPR